jgi:radical SAM protein with 4Fe4S-binding SPASM domain
MPCRRMPIFCGNVLENTLEEIYFQDETFKSLRKRDVPKECAGCVYSHRCRGGARCQSYGRYGSWCRKDPGCPEGNE